MVYYVPRDTKETGEGIKELKTEAARTEESWIIEERYKESIQVRQG